MDVPGYRVPCLIYSPEIIPPRRVDVVASQTDIAPTLLSLMGGSFEHCFMGRNLLAVAEGDGFALLHDGGLAFVRSDRAVVLTPDRPKAMLFQTDPFTLEFVPQKKIIDRQRDALQSEMVAFYRLARDLFQSGAYQRPPVPVGSTCPNR